MVNKVKIHTEYITLGQMLKFTSIIKNGGEEKSFLETNEVKVNSVKETRRGKKLRVGDLVEVNDQTYQICSSNE